MSQEESSVLQQELIEIQNLKLLNQRYQAKIQELRNNIQREMLEIQIIQKDNQNKKQVSNTVVRPMAFVPQIPVSSSESNRRSDYFYLNSNLIRKQKKGELMNH